MIQRCLWGITVALLNAAVATAVVIGSGDGAGNTTPPADDPGFANVGVRGVASAIYLGNRWVLTAAHVGPGVVKLGDTEFQDVPGETVRIHNPNDDNLSDVTDLLLFRLAEEPDLPNLRLPCQPRQLGRDLLMVGQGQDREPEPTFWRVKVGPKPEDDVWTEVPNERNSTRQGFKTLPSQTIRWGAGKIGNTELVSDTRQGDVLAFSSTFTKQFDEPEISHAVRGDSGGAVFEKNAGVWELVGLIFAVDLFENQPDTTRTAVYGNTTLIADLFRYEDEISNAADFASQPPDINGDGQISASEMDALIAAERLGFFASCHYDVDRNGIVNSLDVDALTGSGKVLVGDTDLDGEVGFSDFLTISRTFGTHASGWSRGDFDGDGQVSFTDFLRLSNNYLKSLDLEELTSGLRQAQLVPRATAVPEPEFPKLPCLLIVWLAFRKRDRISPNAPFEV